MDRSERPATVRFGRGVGSLAAIASRREVAVAETKTEPKTEPKKTDLAAPADKSLEKADKKAEAAESMPPMLMRALIGTSGLTLLVGFFLPWIRIPERPPAEEGGEVIAAHMVNGLQLISEGNIGGAPPAFLLLVPILGALLSAAAFMGFRWAGHVAIGIASLLLLFGLWVMLTLFVQHTDLGLWITVGSTFISLLLGVITLLWRRDRGAKAAPKPAAPAPAKAA
jgi:hypothetical protein